jgi:hypothetical protein
MQTPSTQPVAITHLAIGGVIAVCALNLLVRTLFKLGGVPSTLLVAIVVAGGMALWFHLQHRRAPTHSERWRLVSLYGGILALLYLALLGMMWLKDEPGPVGLLIFGMHYFCYPLLAWVVFFKPHRATH